jgi:signal transduction histidine kinase
MAGAGEGESDCQSVQVHDPGTADKREPVAELSGYSDVLGERYNKLNLLFSVTRHDVLNQLAAAQCYVEILQMDDPDPAHRDYINRLASSVSRIAAIMKFSREYQDIGMEEPVWQDAGMLVDIAAVSIHPASIAIINRLPRVQVFADPLISRVFYNIIDNAIRHGGSITRFIVTARKSGPDLVIVCEDDGIGIPAAEKERIFEKGCGKHTGFGLFLAQEILAITGISIRETGEPGRGARFEIHIPENRFRIHEHPAGMLAEQAPGTHKINAA